MLRILLLATAVAAPAFAQTVQTPQIGPSAQGNVSVTVYNQNLALVQDTRQIDIPSGRSRQEFPNVSGQISPETVTLSARDVGVVEQNFDFDLLSPSKLMEKAGARRSPWCAPTPPPAPRNANARGCLR